MNVVAIWNRPYPAPEALNKAIHERRIIHKSSNALTSTDAKCISCFRWAAHLLAAVFVGIGAVFYTLFIRPFESIDSPREELKIDFRNAIKEAIDSVCSKFNVFSQSSEYKNAKIDANDPFYQKVKAFYNQLGTLAVHPDQLREELVVLTKDPLYIERKDKKEWAIDLIQECALALETTNAQSVFQEYGRQRLGSIAEDDIQMKDLPELLKKAREGMPHQRDGIYYPLWAIRNPLKWWHSWGATRDPLEYDSYKHQAVFEVDPFGEGENSLRYKFTPGLTGENSLVQNCLIPALQKKGERWFHITNQSTHKKDENQRIQSAQEISSGGLFQQIVIATDTTMKKGKAIIDQFVDDSNLKLQNLAIKYGRLVRGTDDETIRNDKSNHGIYIPEKILNKGELEAAFSTAREIFINCAKNDLSNDTPQNRIRLAEIMCRNLNSVLSWAVMKKIQSKYPNSTLSQACKENVDRGPFEYLDLKLNEMIYEGKKTITQKDLQLMVGIVLGRGDYAMTRPPQYKRRMKAFIQRFEFICKNLEAVQAQLAALKTRLDSQEECAPESRTETKTPTTSSQPSTPTSSGASASNGD